MIINFLEKNTCVNHDVLYLQNTGERLYHTVSRLSDSLALVVGGRTSPSSAGLGMLWLKFPQTCNSSGPDDVAVELVTLQPAAEAALLRWRHSTTEMTFKGKKPGKSGNHCVYAGSYTWPCWTSWSSCWPLLKPGSRKEIKRLKLRDLLLALGSLSKVLQKKCYFSGRNWHSVVVNSSRIRSCNSKLKVGLLKDPGCKGQKLKQWHWGAESSPFLRCSIPGAGKECSKRSRRELLSSC